MRSAELHHCLRLYQSLEIHFPNVTDVYLPSQNTLMSKSHVSPQISCFQITSFCIHICTAGGHLQQLLKDSTMRRSFPATQKSVLILAHTMLYTAAMMSGWTAEET